MKMKYVSLALILLLIGNTFALTVELNAPNEVASGKQISTQIVLSGKADVVDVGVILPKGFKMTSWNIYGIEKSNVNVSNEMVYDKKMVHFQIKNVDGKVTLETNFITNSSGKLDFVVTYKEGNFTSMAYKSAYIKITEFVCGNGVCEPGENIFNCPVDCGPQKLNYILIIAFAIIAIGGVTYWMIRRWKRVY